MKQMKSLCVPPSKILEGQRIFIDLHLHVRTHTHTYTYTLTHTLKHKHTYTNIHNQQHTHTHKYTLSYQKSKKFFSQWFELIRNVKNALTCSSFQLKIVKLKHQWRRSHFRLTRVTLTRALIRTLQAPYKHAEALRRDSKWKQHSWLFSITATTTCALRVWGVVAQTERA